MDHILLFLLLFNACALATSCCCAVAHIVFGYNVRDEYEAGLCLSWAASSLLYLILYFWGMV